MRTALISILALVLLAPAALAADVALEVQLHELATGGFHILPDAMNANVGDTLTLTVVNQGEIAHDLVVCGDGPTPPSTCEDKWGFVPPLQAGQTATLTATAKKAGTFTYYCTIPGHAAGGMKGTLNVAGEGGAQKPAPGLAAIGTLMTLVAVAVLVRRERK